MYEHTHKIYKRIIIIYRSLVTFLKYDTASGLFFSAIYKSLVPSEDSWKLLN